jgi:DNA-directed RNA polymerase sigma subunit (sigma70/sigma32)
MPPHPDSDKEILRRLSNLETHIINLIIPIQGMDELTSLTSQLIKLLQAPLRVEDNSLLKICNAVNVCANDTARISKDLKNIDILKFAEEMKFMAKRIYEMERAIAEINEKGIKKNIHLDLTLDGYEMVRKSERIKNETPISDDEAIERLLSTLLDRERLVIIHRYGLLGNKSKTLDVTGKEIGITSERVRQIQAKALRKMRHPKRKNEVKRITHKKLLEDIGAQEDI